MSKVATELGEATLGGALAVPQPMPVRRRHVRIGIVPVLMMLILLMGIGAAFLAGLAPYSPDAVDLAHRLTPPLQQGHILGTDPLGRDIFTRLMYGARISLSVAALAILIGGSVGTFLGALSGFKGGRLDAFIMRITEITLGFPLLIVAIFFAAVYGPSFNNVVAVIALGLWAHFARIARGETLAVKEKEFVVAARITGASNMYIIRRHVLPHLVSSLLILASLQAATAILIEAGLSFFGAGVPPPAPSWGSMINDGREYILTAWWIAVFPGVTIAAVVLALNLLGDFLRDTLDPRLRNRA